MFDSKHLDDVAKKLFAILPNSFKAFEEEIQGNFKEVLQAAFARLDLVTREEFDVQAKVLARTREKLDTLEMQLNALIDKQRSNIDQKESSIHSHKPQLDTDIPSPKDN